MNLYGSKAVKIPTPHFYFFTMDGGTADQRELRLSDTFQVKEDQPQLELKATMLNINKGHNKKLLDACRGLAGLCGVHCPGAETRTGYALQALWKRRWTNVSSEVCWRSS